MSEATKAKVDGIKTDFREVLKHVRDGRLLFECGEAMEELVQAVKRTGSGGEFQLKLTVKPAAKGDGSKVLVSGRPKVKVPEPEVLPSMFYATDEGLLCRDNPNQLAFGFEEGDQS